MGATPITSTHRTFSPLSGEMGEPGLCRSTEGRVNLCARVPSVRIGLSPPSFSGGVPEWFMGLDLESRNRANSRFVGPNPTASAKLFALYSDRIMSAALR